MGMKFSKGILVLVALVLVMAGLVFSADSRVRVIVAKANIRLKPDIQSVVITNVPLGAVLEVIRKEADWYYVKLPPDEKGIVITGFLQQSAAEIIEEMPQIKEPAALTKAELARMPLSEKEKYFMDTDPYYPLWRQKLDEARKEQGGARKWMWIGGGAMLVGYVGVPLLAVSTLSESSTGESQNKAVTVGVIAGTVGGALLTYGLIRYLVKGKKVARVMEEGMIKGYILGLNIDPLRKRYSVTFALAF
jgi:hypothetical protein